MNHSYLLTAAAALLCLSLGMASTLAAAVEFNASNPQLVFASEEITAAVNETGSTDLTVSLSIVPDPANPESFTISADESRIEIIGTDSNGAMYGGIQIAEYLRLSLPIENGTHAPDILKRGIKTNMPFDCRAPSYCDKGTAAQGNTQHIWDYEGFWAPYLDQLARYRYNVMSIWCTHPYEHLVKVPGYEDTAIEDIYRVKESFLSPSLKGKMKPDLDTNKDDRVTPEDGTIELVKMMTIDEKIAHWQKVFKHAEDRGIEIYMFHWTVFVNEAHGKYGITEDQTNPKTIDYVRACVKQALLTYPQIKGIGVTSGENDRRELDGTPQSAEHFIRKTYGQGIMDAQADANWVERDIRFIFRRHGTEYAYVKDVMADYTGGVVDTSVKYAVAHMYSSRRPQEWEKRMVGEGWLDSYKVWLNLRNDDIFMHRFGSADYIREFLSNMPHDHIHGFYMGSDGHFWGKEFMSKVPELSGQLEITKHWYNFRMLGEMAYDMDLSDAYWKAALKHRFPSVDADLLFNAWESVSEVVPQVNRAAWAPTDGAFAPEMCQAGKEFLNTDNYYYERKPMILRQDPPANEQHCVFIEDWAAKIIAGEDASFGDKLNPLEVADKLDGYADTALAALPALEQQATDDIELSDVLLDIKSMAYLGQYYADKQRSAAHLKAYRMGGWQDKARHAQAVDYIQRAADHFQAYADVLESHYKTSLHAKTTWFRWYERLEDVKAAVTGVKGEGALPIITYTDLADGAIFDIGHNLDLTASIQADSGLEQARLYVNGLLVGTSTNSEGTHSWKATDHPQLSNLAEDWYAVDIVAVDGKGFVVNQEIYLQVGKAATAKDDWKLEPHVVVMTDGQVVTSGHGHSKQDMLQDHHHQNAADIGITFLFDSGGRILLRDDFYRVAIFRSYSKAGKIGPGPRKCEFKDGVLTTYNLVEPVSILWSSRRLNRATQQFTEPAPSDKGFEGPYELVITKGKKLAIFGNKDGKRQIAWSANPNWDFWKGRFKR